MSPDNHPFPAVGLMKFSVISSRDKGSFISSREKSWEDHVSSMLDPERLRFRLRFLTEVTLPQLDKQTLGSSRNWFSLTIIISELLPQPVKAELYDAALGYPWLRIVERGVDDYAAANTLVRDALCGMERGPGEQPYLSFRLDDDDTLPLNYLENVQNYIRMENVGKFITFTRGAKILWDSKSFIIRNYEVENRSFMAIGLGIVGLFDFTSRRYVSKTTTVFVGMNQFQIKNAYPFIEDDAPNMFIWSHHGFQDTYGRFTSGQFKDEWVAAPADMSEKLAMYPALLKFIG